MKQKVLILCTGNSCRSQMAEGILRCYGDERYEVHSAGTRPSRVNDVAIQVMKEIGIDISSQRSKHLKELIDERFDLIVTVCDSMKGSYPVFPGSRRRLHWSFPDPPHHQEVTEKVVQEFRKVRDLIHKKFKKAAEKGF